MELFCWLQVKKVNDQPLSGQPLPCDFFEESLLFVADSNYSGQALTDTSIPLPE